MPVTYEAIYEDDHLRWLGEPPPLRSARIMVTVLEAPPSRTPRRAPPPELAVAVEILGDLVAPIVADEDWECLK